MSGISDMHLTAVVSPCLQRYGAVVASDFIRLFIIALPEKSIADMATLYWKSVKVGEPRPTPNNRSTFAGQVSRALRSDGRVANALYLDDTFDEIWSPAQRRELALALRKAVRSFIGVIKSRDAATILFRLDARLSEAVVALSVMTAERLAADSKTTDPTTISSMKLDCSAEYWSVVASYLRLLQSPDFVIALKAGESFTSAPLGVFTTDIRSTNDDAYSVFQSVAVPVSALDYNEYFATRSFFVFVNKENELLFNCRRFIASTVAQSMRPQPALVQLQLTGATRLAIINDRHLERRATHWLMAGPAALINEGCCEHAMLQPLPTTQQQRVITEAVTAQLQPLGIQLKSNAMRPLLCWSGMRPLDKQPPPWKELLVGYRDVAEELRPGGRKPLCTVPGCEYQARDECIVTSQPDDTDPGYEPSQAVSNVAASDRQLRRRAAAEVFSDDDDNDNDDDDNNFSSTLHDVVGVRNDIRFALPSLPDIGVPTFLLSSSQDSSTDSSAPSTQRPSQPLTSGRPIVRLKNRQPVARRIPTVSQATIGGDASSSTVVNTTTAAGGASGDVGSSGNGNNGGAGSSASGGGAGAGDGGDGGDDGDDGRRRPATLSSHAADTTAAPMIPAPTHVPAAVVVMQSQRSPLVTTAATAATANRSATTQPRDTLTADGGDDEIVDLTVQTSWAKTLLDECCIQDGVFLPQPADLDPEINATLTLFHCCGYLHYMYKTDAQSCLRNFQQLGNSPQGVTVRWKNRNTIPPQSTIKHSTRAQASLATSLLLMFANNQITSADDANATAVERECLHDFDCVGLNEVLQYDHQRAEIIFKTCGVAYNTNFTKELQQRLIDLDVAVTAYLRRFADRTPKATINQAALNQLSKAGRGRVRTSHDGDSDDEVSESIGNRVKTSNKRAASVAAKQQMRSQLTEPTPEDDDPLPPLSRSSSLPANFIARCRPHNLRGSNDLMTKDDITHLHDDMKHWVDVVAGRHGVVVTMMCAVRHPADAPKRPATPILYATNMHVRPTDVDQMDRVVYVPNGIAQMMIAVERAIASDPAKLQSQVRAQEAVIQQLRRELSLQQPHTVPASPTPSSITADAGVSPMVVGDTLRSDSATTSSWMSRSGVGGMQIAASEPYRRDTSDGGSRHAPPPQPMRIRSEMSLMPTNVAYSSRVGNQPMHAPAMGGRQPPRQTSTAMQPPLPPLPYPQTQFGYSNATYTNAQMQELFAQFMETQAQQRSSHSQQYMHDG